MPDAPLRILVVGGGPAGMKAAAELSEVGHRVTLAEAGPALGGQALLAQLLPGRAEFGGLITNLSHALTRAQVDIRLNTQVTEDHPLMADADRVIFATGARAALPSMEGDPTCMLATDADVLTGRVTPGKSVVIYDARSDWVAIGLAEKLVSEGCHVRLFVNGPQAGGHLMPYMRDGAAGRLFSAGVKVTPYARLFGAEGDTVYFEHTTALAPIEVDGVDTLITCTSYIPNRNLIDRLGAQAEAAHEIGDCRAARTAEEAVLEGWHLARAI